MPLDPERAYPEIKRQYPDVVLFFKLPREEGKRGHYWDVLEADARLVATLAGLPDAATTLRLSMPEATARKHMDTLIRSGRKIAICEAAA